MTNPCPPLGDDRAWNNIDSLPVPRCFNEAKSGIFIHVFSAPARARGQLAAPAGARP